MIVYDMFITITAILTAVIVASVIGSIILRQIYSEYSTDKVKEEMKTRCQIIKLVSLPFLAVLFVIIFHYFAGL